MQRVKTQCARYRSICTIRKHPGICGQVIKKKDAPCLGPRYRSARQSPVQNISAGNDPRWRFRAKQAAANFSLPMHQYGRSILLFKMAFQGYTKMAVTVKKYISAAQILIQGGVLSCKPKRCQEICVENVRIDVPCPHTCQYVFCLVMKLEFVQSDTYLLPFFE